MLDLNWTDLIERNGRSPLQKLGHRPEHPDRRRQLREGQGRRRPLRWRHPTLRLFNRLVTVEQREHGGKRRTAERHTVDVIRNVVAVDNNDAVVRVAVFAAKQKLFQVRLDLLDALGLKVLERVDELQQDEADLLLPRLRVELRGGGQLWAERRQRLDLRSLEDRDENWNGKKIFDNF